MSKTIRETETLKNNEIPDTAVSWNSNYKKPSMTQQHHAQEVNINQIMDRARSHNVVEPNSSRAPRVPIFGDFRGVDFTNALHLIRDAKEDFMRLPAMVRDRFQNNPAKVMDFVSKKENREEAIKLGLIPKPIEPEKKPAGEPEKK